MTANVISRDPAGNRTNRGINGSKQTHCQIADRENAGFPDRLQATAEMSGTPDRNAMTVLFPARKLDHLHVNDAQIRVWLPEKADIALRETAFASDSSVADWVRAFFVAFVYGEHELARMRSTASGLYYEPPPRPDAGNMLRFSRSGTRPYTEPLGKNMCALKVFVPGPLKAAMQAQADKAGRRLSDFVRGVLIERLLGAEVWRESQPAWTPAELHVAEEWEAETD